jgi:CBS domain containing-hemolysin-like protein
MAGSGPVMSGWWAVAAVLLVLLAAWCSSTEAALGRVSRVQVEQLHRQGLRGSAALRALTADPASAINAVLFLRVLSETTAIVLVLLWALDRLDDAPAAWAVVAAMTLVDYVVVGVAARTLGKQHAAAVARLGAPTVRVLQGVLRPVTWLLILLGNAVTPGRGYREGPFSTEAELRDLVDLAEERRLIEDDERQMIHSVFELGDTITREVMVPRTDVVFIESDKTLRQALSLVLRSGFSRIPVVGTGLDDIAGVLYAKDVVRRVHEYREAESAERVATLMRPALFVPDSKPVDELLREMQVGRQHLAVVVDEYGGTAGLVTIEDLLEEIVGEITDEYDTAAPEVAELPGGGWRVSARLHVDDLADLADVEFDADDVDGVDTVGGLLAKRLGKVPIAGSAVTVSGLQLVAESVAGRRNRVDTVRVSPEGATTDA